MNRKVRKTAKRMAIIIPVDDRSCHYRRDKENMVMRMNPVKHKKQLIKANNHKRGEVVPCV